MKHISSSSIRSLYLTDYGNPMKYGSWMRIFRTQTIFAPPNLNEDLKPAQVGFWGSYLKLSSMMWRLVLMYKIRISKSYQSYFLIINEWILAGKFDCSTINMLSFLKLSARKTGELYVMYCMTNLRCSRSNQQYLRLETGISSQTDCSKWNQILTLRVIGPHQWLKWD